MKVEGAYACETARQPLFKCPKSESYCFMETFSEFEGM
jgi:hypothetical protein